MNNTISQDFILTTQHISTLNRHLVAPLLSFFAGAGFLDIGFMQAGFDIIWRNECNISFVQGFEYAMAHMHDICHNGNGKVHKTCSITSLQANQIAQEAFHNLPRPEKFGIIGGPPCPDFSSGGKNRGREGDHGKPSQVYIDIISELQPTFFLFENVPGLLHTIKHRQFLKDLIAVLSKYYFIDLNVLNALEYGVPQDRKRLFLIGFQKEWARHHMDTETFKKCLTWEIVLPSFIDTPNSELLSSGHWFPWPAPPYAQAKTRYRLP